MNLQPLFEAQAKLDKRIVEEKGLQGQDLLDKKILALQVELGELCNNWRGFKFWSEDKKPNVLSYKCSECGFTSEENIDCPLADEYYEFYMNGFNPLLEEYVDCLHFILSIGNDLNINDIETYVIKNQRNTVDAFARVYKSIVDLIINIDLNRHEGKRTEYIDMLNNFINLGEMLGFTWEEIEQAYYEKNKVNHERQANGY